MDQTHFLAAPKPSHDDIDAFYETHGNAAATLWARLVSTRLEDVTAEKDRSSARPLFARRAFGV